MDIVGIVGYGVCIPRDRLDNELIVRLREGQNKNIQEIIDKVKNGLGLDIKSLNDFSEDPITIATEAAENSIRMAGINPSLIGGVTAGSESKPYAVGQIARHVATYNGVGKIVKSLDTEAACDAGVAAVDVVESHIKAGKIDYGLAIGSDVAQAPKGDPLEYAAGAGAAAFVLGKEDLVAEINDIVSFSSLSMDFFRREHERVPKHFNFTTVDSYIGHVTGALEEFLFNHPALSLKDFDYITFHQPSQYMPLKTLEVWNGTDKRYKLEQFTKNLDKDRIRLTEEEIKKKVMPWLIVWDYGNTYAASTMMAVSNILDNAKPGENVLAISYGSGAYASAVWLTVSDKIEDKRGRTPTVKDYIDRKREVDIRTYLERIGKKIFGIGFPRFVGKIEPLTDERIIISQCKNRTCGTIYVGEKHKCLDKNCKEDLEVKSLPKVGELKSFRRVEVLRRMAPRLFFRNYGEEVVLVDCDEDEIKLGMKMEYKIRRLFTHGKSGLIVYGPAYGPLFRLGYGMKKEELVVPSLAS
jgi:hydroxymethylglutaryl-CoA synthase